MRRFPIVVLLCASLAACGSSSSPRPGSSPVAKAAGGSKGDATPSTAAEAGRRASQASAVGAKNGTIATPSPIPSARGYGSNNNMPLKVTLNKTCARRGDRMEVVAVTLPGAQVGFAAAYSDNNTVPDIFWVRGEANPTGTVTWTFLIKPTTPEGDGWLEIVAAKKPNKGASYSGTFRISNAC